MSIPKCMLGAVLLCICSIQQVCKTSITSHIFIQEVWFLR